MIDKEQLDKYVTEAINFKNGMLCQLIANYIKTVGCSLDDISLVERRIELGKTEYYIANKSLEPWRSIDDLRKHLEKLNKALRWLAAIDEVKREIEYHASGPNPGYSNEEDAENARFLKEEVEKEIQ